MTNQKSIVIAGGGFGGVRAALELTKLLPDEKIILINNNPYHVYHSDLYKMAGAVLPKENKITFDRVESTVSIPLKKIFEGKKVQVLVDDIESVDLPGKYLMVQKTGTINFDFLVLALGSSTNFYNIKGARDFAHEFKSAEDALNTRNDIEELIISKEGSVSIVIAGGGFTGTELAGSLAGFIEKLSRKYDKDNSKITILEGSESVLSGMPIWAQKKASKKLEQLGIKVLPNHRISKVEENLIICEDGKSLKFDYLIWTTGVKGENLEGRIRGVDFSPKGQIHVEQDLSLKDFPNVFVVGDLVDLVPSTAWAALSEAGIAAGNIVRRMRGETAENYTPPSPIFVVPVGKGYALTDLAGFQLDGFWGWTIKRLISLKYMLSVLPLSSAVPLWWKGVKIYNKND